MFSKIKTAIQRRIQRDDFPGHPIAQKIRDERLTYLSNRKLNVLSFAMQELESSGVEGSVVECGCALGGSTILLASIKSAQREQYVHDVFDMIPAPTQEDGADVIKRYETIKAGKSQGLGGDEYYGYVEGLKDKVIANIQSYGHNLAAQNIHLIEGLVQDTLDPQGPIALAHIDVDWYDPVKCCLERITPHLAQGGYFIIDDYNDWSGCRTATDEFLEQHGDKFEQIDASASLVLRRV